MHGVHLIDADLLNLVVGRARASERRRTNHNFHRDADDNPHRFLNAMLAGTYVQPHRHRDPPKAESFVVLQGSVAVFLFDDAGSVLARHDLHAEGQGPRGIDIQPGIYHSLVVLSEAAVVFEVKPGPYRREDDKEFAPFAPAEGDADCSGYNERLLAHRAETAAVGR